MVNTKTIHCTTNGCKSTKTVTKFGAKSFTCDTCRKGISQPKAEYNIEKFKTVTCYLCNINTLIVHIFASNEQVCEGCTSKVPAYFTQKIKNCISTSELKVGHNISLKDWIYFNLLKRGYTFSQNNWLYNIINNKLIQCVFVDTKFAYIQITNIDILPDKTHTFGSYKIVKSMADCIGMHKDIKTECSAILGDVNVWEKAQTI